MKPPDIRVARLVSVAIAGAALDATTVASFPQTGTDADPAIRAAIVSEMRRELSAEALRLRIALALDDGRIERAANLIRAARMVAQPVPEDLAARFESEHGRFASAARHAASCARGFVTGRFDDAAGLACSVGADFTVVGDLRDVLIEGGKPMAGGEMDKLVFGLAAIGLALEVATLSSAGTAAGAKLGTSILKASAKSQLASRHLLDEVTAVVTRAVDPSRWRKRPARADDTASPGYQGEVLLDNAKPLIEAGHRLSEIEDRASLAGALHVLRHADTLDDLAAGRTIARHFGNDTAAVMETLGRRALKIAARTLRLSWQLVLLILAGSASLISTILIVWRLARRFRGPRSARCPAVRNPARRDSRRAHKAWEECCSRRRSDTFQPPGTPGEASQACDEARTPHRRTSGWNA